MHNLKRIRVLTGLAAAGLLAVVAVSAGSSGTVDQATAADSMWGITGPVTPEPTNPAPAHVDDSMWG
ncbi:hypothetical protein [Kitasatospora sp. NPDC090091]|uniref:hypothetical protein n=1 Tax=Kitasatospora sp. NPDC090091 TaxID=3364081 RepID=UPI00380EF421